MKHHHMEIEEGPVMRCAMVVLILGVLSLSVAATPAFRNDDTLVGGVVYGGQRFLAQRIVINNLAGAVELTINTLVVRNQVLAAAAGLDGTHLTRIEVVRASDGALLGQQSSAAELGRFSTGAAVTTGANNRVDAYAQLAVEVWLVLKANPPANSKIRLSTVVRYTPRGGTLTSSPPIDAPLAQVFTVGEPIGLARGGVENLELGDRYVFPGERFLAQRIRLTDSDADPYDVALVSLRLENVALAAQRLADRHVARIEVIRAGDGVLLGHATATAGLSSGGISVPTTAHNVLTDDGTMTVEVWVTLTTGPIPDGRQFRLNTVVWHIEGGQTFNALAEPPGNSGTFTTKIVGFEDAEVVRRASANVSPGARFLAQEILLSDNDPNLFDVTVRSLLLRNVATASLLPERHVAKVEVVRKSDGALLGQTATLTGLNEVGVRLAATGNNVVRDDTDVELQVWITLRADAPTGRRVKLSTVVTHTEDTTTFITDPLDGPAEFTTAINQPPRDLSFDWTPDAPKWNETVTFTPRATDPDGDIGKATFEWDFGDGTPVVTRTGPETVARRYGKGGRFTIKLTVTDEGGGKAEVTKTIEVTNAPPRVDFSWAPLEPRWNETVTFTPDATDPDGDIGKASFEWDFGDGTPVVKRTGPERVTHTYAEGGRFTAKITVTDEGGAATPTSKAITVAPRPLLTGMDFDWAPKPVAVGTAVTFTATEPTGASPGTPAPPFTYDWDFGDGTRGTGKTVAHTYAAAGTVTVILTVTDRAGARGRVQEEIVVAQIQNRRPTATRVTPPTAGVEVGQAAAFTATATDPDGDPITGYEWNFGDGSAVAATTTNTVTHTFATSGVFRVQVRARDAGGFGDWFAVDVYVRPRGGAAIGTKLLDNPARTQCRIQAFFPAGTTNVRVQIFDMLGRPVLEKDVVGGLFTWDLKDGAGRAIADGLYFYLITATIGGRTERSAVGRILVLR